MPNIGFLTTSWGVGPSYYRLDLPAESLSDDFECSKLDDIQVEKDGSLTGKTRLPPDYDTEELTFDLDTIVTQRWMNVDAANLTLGARLAGQRIFADLDDHYWELSPDSPTLRATDPRFSPNYNRDLYWNQLSVSDAVICSTPTLEKYLNERLAVTTYLRRNMIDLDLWTKHDTTLSGWEPRIGWSGCTAWRTRDLLQLEGAVGDTVNEYELEFVHIGYTSDAPMAGELLGVNKTTFQISLLDFDLFPSAMKEAKFDIGIVPMENSSFNRAKSCLKGMEYAACGIPFVASPLPEYEWLGIGILAKTPSDWRYALNSLRDPDARAHYAAEGYERVKLEDYRMRSQEYVELFT